MTCCHYLSAPLLTSITAVTSPDKTVYLGWFSIVLAVGFIVFFFFFQAEDGIRDLTVTGVQTCALPIWVRLFGPGLFGTHDVVERSGQVRIGEPVRHDAVHYTPYAQRPTLRRFDPDEDRKSVV